MDSCTTIKFDDAETLTKTLSDVAEHTDVDGLIAMVVEVIMQLARDNKKMSDRVEKLLRRVYSSSSEKLSSSQLELFQAMLKKADDDKGQTDSDAQASDPRIAAVTRLGKKKKKPAGHGRNKLPAHLPRVVVPISVSENERHCDVCGTEKRCIGHTTSERLEYVPASLVVLQERREKLACKPCQGSISIAPVANHIIPGGIAAEGLMAHVIVSKYVDAIPLTRMAKIFRRNNVVLAESTLGDMVKYGATAIPRLVEVIKQNVLASPFLNQDDTGLRVLDTDHPQGIKRGHIWAYVAEGNVVYEYSPDWAGEHPQSFLRDYKGIIQGDGYAGINKLFNADNPNRPIRAGCMMHCRRYFLDAYKAGDVQAGVALALINEIYTIEHNAKVQEMTAAERLALRQEHSMPRMLGLQRFVEQNLQRALPKSSFGKALTYATNQWDSLLVPFSDGRMEIDNGEAERRLKVLATGRKNWLFAGSDSGAERAASLLTVLGTAVNYGLDPLAYLADVFKQIADGLPRSRFHELHPVLWAEKRSQHAAAQQVISPRLAV